MAGRWGDGLWTLADPKQAPDVIAAYRAAAEEAGNDTGEIVLQAAFSWARDDEAALDGARVWKARSPMSSTPTTGTTRRRCTPKASDKSPTTTCARR